MQKYLDKREALCFCLSVDERPDPENFCERKSSDCVEFYVLPDGTKHGLWRELRETTELRCTYNFGVLEGPYIFFDWTWGTIATGNFLKGKPHGVFVFKKGCSAVFEHGKISEHICRGSTCELMCSRIGPKARLEWKWESDTLVVTQTCTKRGEEEVQKTIRYSGLSFVEEIGDDEFSEDEEQTEQIPDCFLGVHLFPPFCGIPKILVVAKKYEYQGKTYESSRGWSIPYFLY